MAVDSTRQICGNCGAFNDPDAVVCVVCGALLAAYATPPEPDAVNPTPSTTTTTTTTTPRPTTDDLKPTTTSATDWRGMFESTPGRLSGTANPLQNLERNFRDDLPQSKATANQAPEAKPDERTQPRRERPVVEAPRTTPPPVETQKQEAFPGQQRRTKEARGRASRASTYNNRPGADPRFNRRRPQSIIGLSVFLLILGCLITFILLNADSSDTLVGGVFLCFTSLGLIALVSGIVITVSRKEGRGG
ncbi:hypothetical protein BH09CHL1_BH09CHL1_23650 [soil metagenome]